MKKLLIILGLIIVITNINSCGSLSTNNSGKTKVTINLGETKTASRSGKLLSASAIPTNVKSVRFIISAADMATIQRAVSTEGKTTISELFDVPNGTNRHFLVEAIDTSGNVLYRGDTYANLTGTPVTLSITLASTITSPAWAKTYGGTDYDSTSSIQQTSDGGYIIAGYTYSFGAGNNDFWLLKVNSDGTIAWQKTYGGTSYDSASSIQQTTDGGYIVAGTTDSFGAGGTDFWVLKLNNDGTIAWQKTYGGTSYDSVSSIQQTSDGGYIVAGVTYSSGAGSYDFWVLKLNSDGTTAWQKTYGGTSYDFAYSIQQTTDGGYIVAGYYYFDYYYSDFWVLKLNSDGTIAWQKTYGGTYSDWASSIQQTTDGGYIVAGTTDSFGAGGDCGEGGVCNDFLILKLNSSGAVEWQKTYGGTMDDWPYFVQQTTDGGYIVAGTAGSFGAGGDSWVLKLNSDGTITFNPSSGASSTDTNATVTDTTVTGVDTSATVTDTTVTGVDTNATVADTNATIQQQAP